MVAPTGQTENFGLSISVFLWESLEGMNVESPVEELSRKVLIRTDEIIPKTYLHRSHQVGSAE